ncbi:MAG: hypothetical protein JW861_01040 [Bacteroidales bacterium]|nr:hypothetical protein [Bacteroidales bacterium]
MDLDYQCPHCNGYLNTEDCLVFSATAQSGLSGLIYLHPEIGNYTVRKHPSFNYSEGESLKFFCPICHAPLSSGVHERLARIIMIDETGKRYDILFSQVAGEQSTYKIIGETVEIFGDDSAEYLDYINLSMNF